MVSKTVLTPQDISNLITRFSKIFATKAELGEVKKELLEKISHLPTKNDFYTKMDEVMGELKAIREEQIMFSHRSSDREDRITSFEEIHPQGTHTAL